MKTPIPFRGAPPGRTSLGGMAAAIIATLCLVAPPQSTAADHDKPKDNPKGPPARPSNPNARSVPGRPPSRSYPPPNRTGPGSTSEDVRPPVTRPDSRVASPHAEELQPRSVPIERNVRLEKKPIAGGGYTKTTPSGAVRESLQKKPDGDHTRYLGPTGRVQREEVQKQDGTRVSTHYDDSGKVSREIVARKDGSRQVSRPQFARDGTQRAVETVHYDTRGAAVSRTVEVKQTTVIANRTTIINNTTVIKHYDRCRYGYAYRPVVFVHSPVFISWYDPFWYTPAGIFIVHPFSYSWGWYGAPWYRCHRYYWSTYEVYPGPAYWLTDWMLAGYLADRYAMSVSLEQAQEEARRAREDAERARQVAEQARDAAEIAEARRARDEAEARAAKAEARAARAEAEEAKAKETDVKANPNATPIDAKTKEALKDQIERTIAEKKDAGDGKAIVADLSKALADPKHIYPVSRTIDVTLADNGNRAGNLTEGDLLRLEPGQDLKNANENTLVTMRVMTSKGEDDEVKAGTLISVGLKDLQEFDNEFRAKVDLGMAEADQNKELFKKGAK